MLLTNHVEPQAEVLPEFTSELDGTQEVDSNDSTATGTATLQLNEAGDALSYSVTVTGLDFGVLAGESAQTEDTGDDVQAFHFHNAARGVNGDVVFDILGQDTDDLSIVINEDDTATISGIWEETDSANVALSEFVQDLRDAAAGEDVPLYFNIHTEDFPGGEIRGQVVAEEEPEPQPAKDFTSVLDGTQEVESNDSTATGAATLQLNEAGDALSYSVTVTGLDFGVLAGESAQTEDTGDDVQAFHFHNAARGVNGDVVFDILNQDEDDLSIVINEDETATISGIWEETDSANVALSEFVQDLRDAATGEDVPLYLNIHTEDFPGGEIRGQVVAQEELEPQPVKDFTSELDGTQEVDSNDSTATGTASLQLNEAGDGLSYSVTVTGLDFGVLAGESAQTEDTGDDVQAFHFHNAARGVNGDVVFDILNQDEDDLNIVINENETATISGIWEETDSANVALSEFVQQLREANSGEDVDLYFNIHTEDFPGGEIRGQVVAEEELEPQPAKDFTSELDGTQEVDSNDSTATGTATLQLNEAGDALSYSVTVTGLDFGVLAGENAQTEDTSDDVQAFHFHNAARGVNGDVVFDILGQDTDDLNIVINEDETATITGIWEETDSANVALSEFVQQLRDAAAGEDVPLYFNIHTEDFPGGEIRGQVVAEEEPEPQPAKDFTAELDGTQEVESNDSTATGAATLQLNEAGDALSYSVTVTGLDFGVLAGESAQTEDTGDDVQAFHFHNAARGVNGDVVFDILGQDTDDLSIVINEDDTATISGVWEETDSANVALSEFIQQLREANSGEDVDLYFNIHTEDFPGGEIRGQVVAEEVLAPPELVFGTTGNDTLEAGITPDFDGSEDLVFAGSGEDLVDFNTANTNSRAYAGTGADELFASTGDRLFGGEGDDTFDAAAGSGNNRLYGGAGNDSFFLGTNDVLVGGDGDDKFFVGSGGENRISGGVGADEFWLANAETPSDANTIVDLEIDTDVIGIALEGVSSIENLGFRQNGDNAVVSFGEKDLGIFLNTQATDLEASATFVFA